MVARVIEVYPKVVLDDATWQIRVKMRVIGTGQTQTVVRQFPAGVTGNLRLLKLVLIVRVPDSVTPTQLGGGLFDHIIGTTIYPGTFWDYWQALYTLTADQPQLSLIHSAIRTALRRNRLRQFRRRLLRRR